MGGMRSGGSRTDLNTSDIDLNDADDLDDVPDTMDTGKHARDGSLFQTPGDRQSKTRAKL
jgi:hypothetical protein